MLLAASTWFAPERVVWSQVGRYRFCAEHNERRTVNCLRRSRTLQNGDIAESLYRSIQPFWRHSRNGKKHAGTTSPMTWVFASRRHPWPETNLGPSNIAQVYSARCVAGRNSEAIRMAYVFDAAEKRGYGIQSLAGTVAAFNSAINLGCVYPANHACQTCSSGSSVVLGVLARSEWNNRRHWATLRREGIDRKEDGRKVDTKKGTKTCPFGSMVSLKLAQILWKQWRGRRDSNPRPLP